METSKEYAERLARESRVPCTIVQVDKLPKEFESEDEFGESQYRSMDGDCCFRHSDKVAEKLDRWIDPRNRAYGSVTRSKTIYYVQD